MVSAVTKRKLYIYIDPQDQLLQQQQLKTYMYLSTNVIIKVASLQVEDFSTPRILSPNGNRNSYSALPMLSTRSEKCWIASAGRIPESPLDTRIYNEDEKAIRYRKK